MKNQPYNQEPSREDISKWQLDIGTITMQELTWIWLALGALERETSPQMLSKWQSFEPFKERIAQAIRDESREYCRFTTTPRPQ